MPITEHTSEPLSLESVLLSNGSSEEKPCMTQELGHVKNQGDADAETGIFGTQVEDQSW